MLPGRPSFLTDAGTANIHVGSTHGYVAVIARITQAIEHSRLFSSRHPFALTTKQDLFSFLELAAIPFHIFLAWRLSFFLSFSKGVIGCWENDKYELDEYFAGRRAMGEKLRNIANMDMLL